MSTIQTTLARSYLSYFIFSIMGLLLDSLFRFEVVVPFGRVIAITCFIIGPLLIWWAQSTSSNPVKTKNNESVPYFLRGPYKILRNPTHLGMVILVTGYAAVSGSILFLTVTVIGYIVSNMLFKKYELMVTEEYGENYTQYKSDVPKIL